MYTFKVEQENDFQQYHLKHTQYETLPQMLW